MATAVYTLCALLSLACAILLLAILGDDKDLRWARSITFLAGTTSLLVGLIWDASEGDAR